MTEPNIEPVAAFFLLPTLIAALILAFGVILTLVRGGIKIPNKHLQD